MAGLLAPTFVTVFKDGQVLIGGQIKAFETTTSTPKAIYQDADLTTPWSSSIATTDSNGIAKIYLDQGNYRFDFHDTVANGGGFLYRLDPVQGVSGSLTITVPVASTTINTTQNGYIFANDATAGNITDTLPDTGTVGDNFKVTVGKIDSSVNTVSVAAFSGQNIEGQSTITLSGQWEFITLISKSTGWYIVDRARALYDQNMQKVVSTVGVASAVNYLEASNSATGNNPSLSSKGTDTNIGQEVILKGTGQQIIKSEDTRTTTVAIPSIIRATTSGTPAAGIGVGQTFQAESADENPSDFGQISFVSTDITAGSEDTYFSIATRRAGAALAAMYDFITTTAFKYVFTGAPTANRTVTLPDSNLDKWFVQRQYTSTGGGNNSAATIPLDDTIPQISEGFQVMTLAITPKGTTNTLMIDAVINVYNTGANVVSAALFQDATADALAVASVNLNTSRGQLRLNYSMPAGTTSATTFQVRVGGNAGTTAINGTNASREFGGKATTAMSILEHT